MEKPNSAACERNRDPILDVLRDVFADRRRVLEIGSGTGQHAVYFAAHLPQLTWQTSDLLRNHPGIRAWIAESGLANVALPLVLDAGGQAQSWPDARFDAVFTANTCHIMSWEEVQKMFAGIPRVLDAGGLLCVYGPFNYNGGFTSESNACFDAALKREAPHMGLRDIEAMNALASTHGFVAVSDYAMPANNRLLVWRLASPSAGR